MKLINIFVAFISGAFVLTYIITGFDFVDKERLVTVTNDLMFIIFLGSLYGVYISFKSK